MNEIADHLSYLKLSYIRENYEIVAKTAARKQWDPIQYLSELIKQESNLRRDRTIQRRIRMAKFPVIKTLDQFNWSFYRLCWGGKNPYCLGFSLPGLFEK